MKKDFREIFSDSTCHVIVSFGKSGFMLKIFRDRKIL